jgi:hypothetical protein
VQTKLEVFDWLVRNQDKRVAKNPAGYLVASVRADYRPPGDYKAAGEKARAAADRRAAEEAERQQKRRAREQAEHDRAREADLRARWEKLPESERNSILAAVKAANPGLGRWKKMLDPLCFAEMERRHGPTPPGPAQKRLFDAD